MMYHMLSRTTCKLLIVVVTVYATLEIKANHQEDMTSECTNYTGSSLPNCPRGSTCRYMHNSFAKTKCFKTSISGYCRTHKQCDRYRCVTRVGECGFCSLENQSCVLDPVSLSSSDDRQHKECCEGFCDVVSDTLSGNRTGICRRYVDKGCIYDDDCLHGMQCHQGVCQRCKRQNEKCYKDIDCCSFKCVETSYGKICTAM